MGSKNTSFHDGSWGGVLLFPWKLAFWMGLGFAGLLVLAWTVDWVFVSRVWPEGVSQLRALLDRELAYGVALAARQGRELVGITGPANALYGLVFECSGIHAMGERFADGSALSIPDTVVRQAYVSHRDQIEVAMVGTQLLGLRFATLMRFLPLGLLLYAVGAVDGMTRRLIRRSAGGRESASVYHRAKYLQMTVVGLGGVTLLVWPAPVAWETCAGLGVLAIAVLARQQWALYKKHL